MPWNQVRSWQRTAFMAVTVLIASAVYADGAFHFNLPPQELSASLRAVGRQTGTNVIFEPAIVDGINASGFSAELTVEGALKVLLSGTTLQFQRTSADTIVVRRENSATSALSSESHENDETALHERAVRLAQVEPQKPASIEQDKATGTETMVVIATGSQVELTSDYAGGQVARGGRVGLFGNLDTMDTPFNATNYTAEFMRNLQARSVADVAQSDAGVRVARGFGNFQELYVVRGFPVYSDDMSYNGLYGLLPRQYVAAEFLERIEVFRGANTFLNGAAPGGSGVGGAFNLVPKRAPTDDLSRLSVGFENDSQLYAAADMARRFGEGRQYGVRVNGVRRMGDTAIENENHTLGMGSLGVDYRGERARFSADFGLQNHHIDAPRPSVTPGTGIPDPADADSNFAQKWTFTEERDFFGVIRGEWDVTEKGKIWGATGLRDGTEHNILSNPRANADGSTSSYRFDNYREDRITTSELGFRTEFKTGGIGHRVSASGTIFKSDSKNAYAFSSFAGFANNLYAPTDVAAPLANFFTGGQLFSPLTTSLIKTTSYAVADMLAFMDERLLVTLGARYQVIEQNSYNYNTGAQESGYDESTVTPVVGVVVKPTEQFSVYANYIEGLIKGEVAPNVAGTTIISNAGEVFEPFKSKQYEVGVKYDRGSFGGALAVFRVTKPTAIVTVTSVTPTTTGVFGPDGEQRNQGIELNWYGEPLPGLRALGGVTFLDAKMTKTQSGVNDGKKVIGVPDTQANVGLEWDVPRAEGLTLDGRVIYTSSQPANGGNTLSVPAWTRLDVGTRYAAAWMGRKVTLRARIDNVTNRDYWASVGGSFDANYLVLGSPRTFAVSGSIDF